ncbi:hypothetical protein [Streptomyces sp. NPDC048516]|uniref:hypothetical protein n=1 Tax=Streptomyces sp. NPDC048516 TaxID=3365565 RepID=UPI0037214944
MTGAGTGAGGDTGTGTARPGRSRLPRPVRTLSFTHGAMTTAGPSVSYRALALGIPPV